MKAVALAVGLAMVAAEAPPASPRGYAGALAVPTQDAGSTEPAPVVPASRSRAATPESTARAAPTTAAEAPPPPRPVAHPSGLSGRRLAMQRAGVAAVMLGAAGWVATIVGLGLGSAADSDIAPLRARDEIDRRRELLDRGRLANRLALGAGISAGVMLALGVTLLAVARRQRSRTTAAQVRAAQARAAR